MYGPLPRGLFPVMLTSFCENLSIDWSGIDALTEFYIEQGASGLFACCLSSQMYDLEPDERIALVRRVASRAKRVAGSGFPVVASGTFGGAVNEQADFVRQVADAGADVVVVLLCQIVAEEEDDQVLRSRLQALEHMTDGIRLGFYECPVPYHRHLPAEMAGDAGRSGRYHYVKDTTLDAAAVCRKVAATEGTSLGVYNAYVPTLLESLACGAAGCSPISANYYPELFAELCRLFDRDGSTEAVRRLHGTLTELQPVTHERYTVGAKYFLSRRGVPIGTGCRGGNDKISREDAEMIESLEDRVRQIRAEFGVSS